MKLSNGIFNNWWLVESRLCLFAPKCCEGGGALQIISYQVVDAVRVDSTRVGVGTPENIVGVSWGRSNSNCYNQIHLNFSRWEVVGTLKHCPRASEPPGKTFTALYLSIFNDCRGQSFTLALAVVECK